MRDINNFKFRLYNKVTGQMFEDLTGFVVDQNKQKIMIFRMNDLMPDGIGTQTFKLEDVELMQYTGLQDKNGMSEIKFRGKRVDTGKWVHGGYYKQYKYKHINEKPEETIFIVRSNFHNSFDVKVIPETVGMFWRNINDQDYYEGDVFEITYNETVRWFINRNQDGFLFASEADIKARPNTAFGFLWDNKWVDDFGKYFKKIGNIHDNPELLEVK